MLYLAIFLLLAVAGGDSNTCQECRPTCAVPNPEGCSVTNDPNDSSQCQPGFVLSEEGGECIRTESCPEDLGCNGDRNAVIRECPSPCPSTCDSPNSSLKTCTKECKLGCECKPGFILSKENGKCILPDKCPGGNPCNRPNELYSSCTVSCTPTYCPVDDVDRITICDFPSPCDSGCVCKHNHRRLSVKNDTCILAEKCPPVKCTKKNQAWNPCPLDCPGEYCSDINKLCPIPLIRTCNPRCTCKPGYCKNNKDVCVPKPECSK